MARTNKFYGKCGCGRLGYKHGGMVSCPDCIKKDERAGVGLCKTVGFKHRIKRGELRADAN